MRHRKWSGHEQVLNNQRGLFKMETKQEENVGGRGGCRNRGLEVGRGLNLSTKECKSV